MIREKEKEEILEEIIERLNVNLNTTLGTTLLQSGEQVGDIIPRVSVETSAQSLLVEVVSNETNAAAKDEETVENSHLHVVFNFLGRESTAVAHQVNETDSNATIDVQNEVVLLGGGDSFNSDGIVEKLGAGEVLLSELLDQLDTQIGVVPGLDSVANTRDYAKVSICSTDVHYCKDHLLSLFSFLIVSTKSRGLMPLSKALVNSSAAPSRAPPKRDPMVRRPETRALIRSLPARVVIMVFMAPDTAGPWSAVSMRTISKNLLA